MGKYKVGDKVKIKEEIKTRTDYSVVVVDEMKELAGQICTISTHWGEDYYQLDEDPGKFAWAGDMFELAKPKRTTKADVMTEMLTEHLENNTKAFEKFTKGLDKLIDKVNERTMYDDVILEQMKKKIQEVAVEDLTNEVHKDVDKYIKDNFGILPKKIEIQNGSVTREMVGLFHKKFGEILNIVNKGVPLMLTGPAGAGKNHTLEQVSEALGLPFYFTNAITQEFKLTGFIDANGKYQETQFYKAFKDGGVFFLDEIDASCPESLIILNSAIANGYFDFPNGRVDVHENFRCVCAGNTFGTGADMIYVGRNALDGATLDRFATIEFDYDEDIEKQLAYDDELYQFIKALRKAIKDASLRYIVSMRATINATKLLEIGMDKEDILKSVVIKNMQIDDLNTIIKKIDNSSEWKRCLERLGK